MSTHSSERLPSILDSVDIPIDALATACADLALASGIVMLKCDPPAVVHAPMTLLPSAFPASAVRLVLAIQPAINAMMLRVRCAAAPLIPSLDEGW
jgi:hypothetical protein